MLSSQSLILSSQTHKVNYSPKQTSPNTSILTSLGHLDPRTATPFPRAAHLSAVRRAVQLVLRYVLVAAPDARHRRQPRDALDEGLGRSLALALTLAGLLQAADVVDQGLAIVAVLAAVTGATARTHRDVLGRVVGRVQWAQVGDRQLGC